MYVVGKPAFYFQVGTITNVLIHPKVSKFVCLHFYPFLPRVLPGKALTVPLNLQYTIKISLLGHTHLVSYN